MNHASQLLAAAQLAADRAGRYLRAQEGRLEPSAWGQKGRADFVTEADREAERIIAESLLERVPGSAVVGEELSPEAGASGVTWLVDPLDGTTNFLHGFPFYAVSIAALMDGDPVAGLVDHVPLGIRYHATRGGGAHRNGARISVSRVTEPRHALIGTGFPFKFVDLLPRYQKQFAAVLSESAGIRRPGSAALDLCEVAQGRFDGFWELVLAPWDVAAGTLLVREAGGVVTDLAGDGRVLRHGPIVAGNPAIHGWLLELLNTVDSALPNP